MNTRFLLGAASCGLSLLLAVPAAPAATFSVTTNEDSGAGSFRDAIEQANLTAASDSIQFNLPPETTPTIRLLSALPDVTERVHIVGQIQNGGPRVTLSGELLSVGSGLVLKGTSCTLTFLNIGNFPEYGIRMEGGGGHSVQRCFIGTTVDGRSPAPNAMGGIAILNSANNRIGQPRVSPLPQNVISGNGLYGVYIDGSASRENLIQGSYIGVTADGYASLGNAGRGVYLGFQTIGTVIGGGASGAGNVIAGNSDSNVEMLFSGWNVLQGNSIGLNASGWNVQNSSFGILMNNSSQCLIGGSGAGERNLISGHGTNVYLFSPGSWGNRIQGNWIGLDAAGEAAAAAGPSIGVRVDNAPDNLIGGTGAGEGNVISGNYLGVLIDQSLSVRNQILGNRIGPNVQGSGGFLGLSDPLLRGQFGVFLGEEVRETRIGGWGAGEANTIAYLQTGVLVSSGHGTSVVGNSIHSCQTMAIDLGDGAGASGPSDNDPLDADSGPNHLQNHPVLTHFEAGGGVTTVTGELDSAPNSQYQIDIYGSPHCPGVRGDGKTGLATLLVTTDGSGHASFGGVFPTPVAPGAAAATATDLATSSTSEFSPCLGEARPALLVTNTDTSGPGSLYDILEQANTTPGPDRIHFNIPGPAPHIIDFDRDYTGIYDPVTIDGTTNPDYAGTPVIVIRGDYTKYYGFFVSGGGTTIRGLRMWGFREDCIYLSGGGNHVIQGCHLGADTAVTTPSGCGIRSYASHNNLIGGSTPEDRNVVSGFWHHAILLDNSNNNRIIGNYIGTDETGTTVIGNNSSGILLTGSFNIVGGHGPGEGNVISGNAQAGISIATSNSGGRGDVIEGNYIGVDVTGTKPLPNTYAGIDLYYAYGTRIGGTAPGAGNVISANLSGGIAMTAGCSDIVVQGNRIGTDVTGSVALGNAGAGVGMGWSARNCTIGGTEAGARNILSGNEYGVVINGTGASNNRIQGNLIGTAVDGVSPLGNTARGIYVTVDANDNLIGGTAAGAGNVIAFNGTASNRGGVGIAFNCFRVGVLGNSIHSNIGPGIDLGEDGATPNDPGDSDNGDNERQNFPLLENVSSDTTGTFIVGTFNSEASQVYRVEFFNSPGCDGTGHGEGQTYLGTVNVTTDELGNGAFSVLLPQPVPLGSVVTATATDSTNNTSEFSPCRVVSSVAPDISVTGGPVAFGNVLVGGGATAPRTLTIRNTGVLEMLFTGAGYTLEGPNAGEFALVGSPSTAPLEAGGSRTVQVTFTPGGTGLRSASLVITTDDPDETTVTLSLTGRGVTDPAQVTRVYNGAGPGTSTIGAGGTYPTLKAACDAVNAAPLTGGNWVFEILSNLNETANSALGQATNGHSLIFRPAEGVSPVVTFNTSSSPVGHPGHFLIGSRNELNTTTGRYMTVPTARVVIDGSNSTGTATRNLTLKNTVGSVGRTHIVVVAGDSDAVEIRNCQIQHLGNGAGSHYGVLFQQVYDPANGLTDAIPDNGLVENCLITNSGTGASQALAVVANVLSTSPTLSRGVTGLVVRGNSIAARGRSFFFANCQSATVENNVVRLNQTSPGTNSFGMLLTDLGNVMNNVRMDIRNNKFEQINAATNHPTIGMTGIQIEYNGSGDVYNIVNNMLGGLRMVGAAGSSANSFAGIRYAAAQNATVNIYHNSIDMLASPGSYSGLNTINCTGIAVTNVGFTGTATIRNNIVRIAQPGGAAIARLGSGGTFLSDFNNFFAADGAVIGRSGSTDCATLEQWTTASGQDQGSSSLDPAVAHAPYTGRWSSPAASNSDLHFTADPGPEFTGIPMAAVRTDIDGEARSLTAPRKGADEVPGADVVPDQDNDDVPGATENGAPNGGDGNADGTSDSLQAHVTSLPAGNGAGYLTLVSEPGTSLEGVVVRSNPSRGNSPADVTFPVGFLGFTVTGVTTGSTTLVTLILPEGVTVNGYYRHGPKDDPSVDQWYTFPYQAGSGTGAQIQPGRIVLHFRDGAHGDDDGTANGRVTDPGAPAVLPVSGVAEWSLY